MPRQFKTVALWGRLGERSVMEPARQVLTHLRKRGITVLAAITSDDWKKMKPASATRPAYSVLDLSKFEQTTGRSMRPWREALREFRSLP